jgi:3-oxoacyl-[acyl-carrier protein] reductase
MKQPVDVNSVAKTILFLLSDDAKSITGQNIHVDNGTI